MNLRPPARELVRAAAWPLVVLAGYLLTKAGFGSAVNWPPFNIGIHVAGGVAIAHLAGVVIAPVLAALHGPTREAARAVGLLALTATTAVSWEFFECVVARIYGVRGPSAGGDTLRDIAAGMAGALLYALVTRRRSATRSVGPSAMA